MKDDNDEQDSGYVLAMPLTCVQSEGGPYEDVSFVAGMLIGEIYMNLKIQQAIVEVPEPSIVPRNLAAQVDLIAMKFGFSSLTEETDVDEYVRIVYSPQLVEDDYDSPLTL